MNGCCSLDTAIGAAEGISSHCALPVRPVGQGETSGQQTCFYSTMLILHSISSSNSHSCEEDRQASTSQCT